jgi:hypothetical protein
VDWETAEEANLSLRDLEKSGEDGAVYAELPPAAGKAASYAAWTKTFQTWLYGCQKLELYRSPSLKQVSRPGESERDFRVRISQLAREQRDGAVEALRKKYTAKIASLQERLRKAQQAVDREKEQAKDAKMQTAISFGATLLGALTGRKSVKTSLGRATTAARGVSRSMQQGQDVGRAEDTVEALQKQLADLQAQFDAEAQELQNRIDPQSEDLETLTLKPKKADIAIQLVCLVWAPYWQDDAGGLTPAW